MTDSPPAGASPGRWRSALFVPGNDDRKLEKASAGEADAIIVDLEDGVGASAKPAARRDVAAWTDRLAAGGHDVVVRVNAGWRDLIADIEAIAAAPIAAVMIPKVETADKLDVVLDIVDDIAGRPAPLAVIALIETPAAFADLFAIARNRRVVGLAFGSEDYAAALGVEPDADVLDLPCRMLAMAGAGKTVLAAPLSIARFDDPDALRSAYGRARRLGATGALCIHPAQVAVANRTFVPSPEELAAAARALDAWHEAVARGAAVVAVDGRMIDKPVAARLQRLIDAV